jgi:sentrin-specific protease 1
MIIGFCLPWMESQEETVALTIIQRDNTLFVDQSILMSLSHNKPKKWWRLQ